MNTVNRLLVNICSDDLRASKVFYMSLFDFSVNFESDWFVQLVSNKSNLELGIILKTHDLVPSQVQGAINGSYLTIVVDGVEEIYQKAKELKYEILKKPEDLFYGQRRLLIKDPNGFILDVSAPIPNFSFG